MIQRQPMNMCQQNKQLIFHFQNNMTPQDIVHKHHLTYNVPYCMQYNRYVQHLQNYRLHTFGTHRYYHNILLIHHIPHIVYGLNSNTVFHHHIVYIAPHRHRIFQHPDKNLYCHHHYNTTPQDIVHKHRLTYNAPNCMQHNRYDLYLQIFQIHTFDTHRYYHDILLNHHMPHIVYMLNLNMVHHLDTVAVRLCRHTNTHRDMFRKHRHYHIHPYHMQMHHIYQQQIRI